MHRHFRHIFARRAVPLLVVAAATAIAAASVIAAQHGPQQRTDAAGFDFWVLALSWSPSYCLLEGQDDAVQCGRDRRNGFVVHGLWPQFERGYPAHCDIGPQRIAGRFADEMADLMPTRRLVFHQWRKHGRCSGLTPDGYFAETRAASHRVRIPDRFDDPVRGADMSPAAIEAAFIAANAGLGRDAMAAVCHRGRFLEVRICLDKDLRFRACREVDTDDCPLARINVPVAP